MCSRSSARRPCACAPRSRTSSSRTPFRKRLNKKALDEDDAKPATGGDWSEWYRGEQARNRGSLHSDSYCTGREPRAFCMDFISATDAFEKMKNARADMDEKRPLKKKAAGTDQSILGAFLTNHDESGAVVEIPEQPAALPRSRRTSEGSQLPSRVHGERPKAASCPSSTHFGRPKAASCLLFHPS